MSAPTIPNLNSLRRGGLRGRGRGQGQGGSSGNVGSAGRRNHDETVQNTDNDAVASRISAVEAGYLEDPFARLLASGEPVSRRLPLMNRGTYIRTTGIDRIVDTFLSTPRTSRKQIISLGAGSDTRYFRLKQKRRDFDAVYHEIDFAVNTRRKINHLRSPQFVATAKAIAGVDVGAPEVQILEDGSMLKSPDYIVHSMDLRQLHKSKTNLTGVDVTLATLVISECCLVYLPPADADAVLQYFSQLFPNSTPLAIVIYEPIRPHDSFGKTMVSNLMTRGIQLQTLQKYAGLEEQRERLRTHGFDGDSYGSANGAEASDVGFIWRKWIALEEKERVEGLEWMDEVEEFNLLAKHYCICWGWRGFDDDSLWRALPRPTEMGVMV